MKESKRESENMYINALQEQAATEKMQNCYGNATNAKPYKSILEPVTLQKCP